MWQSDLQTSVKGVAKFTECNSTLGIFIKSPWEDRVPTKMLLSICENCIRKWKWERTEKKKN